jgi:hypothetical protein
MPPNPQWHSVNSTDVTDYCFVDCVFYIVMPMVRMTVTPDRPDRIIISEIANNYQASWLVNVSDANLVSNFASQTVTL